MGLNTIVVLYTAVVLCTSLTSAMSIRSSEKFDTATTYEGSGSELIDTFTNFDTLEIPTNQTVETYTLPPIPKNGCIFIAARRVGAVDRRVSYYCDVIY